MRDDVVDGAAVDSDGVEIVEGLLLEVYAVLLVSKLVVVVEIEPVVLLLRVVAVVLLVVGVVVSA